jgi:predicted thioesterase
MPKPIEPLAETALTHRVAPEDLASAVALAPGERFPAVLATTRMIALMELAAARALAPLLEDGELSVGVTVDVAHTAATPAGATVRCTARYLGRDGRLFDFEVAASDEAGECGRGRHRRAIVAVDRLLAGMEKRRAAAGAVGP